MYRLIAVLLAISCSGACAAGDGRQNVEPAQCFIVDEPPNGAFSGALEKISGALGLEIETSMPNYLLLKTHSGTPRILLAYAPKEVGSILVSYRDMSGEFIDLRKVSELHKFAATSKRCPVTGKDFSPPRFFE
jgi:hypothetical protein